MTMQHIKSILIVTTSHDRMGDTGEPTGIWLEELAAPYFLLKDAGMLVTIASISGGTLPIDPRSLQPGGENPAVVERFLADPEASAVLADSPPLNTLDLHDFAAVFFPGGHGTMWDLPQTPLVGQLITEFLAQGKPVAAVCHGPAALVNARAPNGHPVVAGRRVCAFSNREESAVGLLQKVPFLLEDKLLELGAKLEIGPDFEPHAIRDGLLITGQNPASSEQVAQLLLEAVTTTVAASQ